MVPSALSPFPEAFEGMLVHSATLEFIQVSPVSFLSKSVSQIHSHSSLAGAQSAPFQVWVNFPSLFDSLHFPFSGNEFSQSTIFVSAVHSNPSPE